MTSNGQPKVGSRVSHFELVELLGGGGMGVVYKARDLKLDRLVALKFLPSHLTADPSSRARFLQEAQATSALDHRNIATVYEVDEDENGRLFIAMSYYDGETVAERLARGPLPVEEAVRIAAAVARGLAAAHQRGIVHRDIKPANVMITKGGEAKILDFGLVKLLGQVGVTRSGLTVGTAAYMSPEQVRGRGVDHRTDIWSLGVTLYEMLTGELPFDGDTPDASLLAVLHQTPRPPSELRPETPTDLDRIVERALAKDPDQRYADVAQMTLHLDGVLAGSQPTQLAIPRVPRKRLRLPRRALVVGGLVIATAVLAAGVWLWRRPAPEAGEHPQTLAVLPLTNLTGDPANDFVAEGISTGVITEMSEVSGLQVVGRSEAWSRRHDASLGELARRLGVSMVLEGELQQHDGQLEAQTRLTDPQTGIVLWSDRFSGDAGRLFDLQRQVARNLTRFLEIPLTAKERRRLARNPSDSTHAYELYLKAERQMDEDNQAADDLAAEAFQQALRLDPNFALAHVGLSEVLWRIYDRNHDPEIIKSAQAHAETAARIDPDLPAARIALARVWRSTGRIGDSIDALRSMLADLPKPDEAQRELAQSYEEAGELRQAEECLQAAIALGQDNWLNWNALGSFLVDRGRYPEARQAFQRAAQLTPTNVFAPQHNLAAVRLLEGDFKGAVAAFEQIQGATGDATLLANIGTAYFFLGKLERAQALYQRSVRIEPGNPILHRNLADVLMREGQPAEAKREYGEALRLVDSALAQNPRDTELRLQQALYSARVERCDQAGSLARELARTIPASARSSHLLAEVFALCDLRRDALDQLRQAIRLGFAPKLVREEDEFRSLRSDPGFRSLTREAAESASER